MEQYGERYHQVRAEKPEGLRGAQALDWIEARLSALYGADWGEEEELPPVQEPAEQWDEEESPFKNL